MLTVKQRNVRNCFQNAGFGREYKEQNAICRVEVRERLESTKDKEFLIVLRLDFQKYIELLNVANEHVYFDSFLEIYYNVLIKDYPTDQDIVESVHKEQPK